MSINTFKKLYSTIVFGMTMLHKDTYWMLKNIIQFMPAFSSIKTLKFEKGNMFYGDREVGNQSADNQMVIINSKDFLKTIKKENNSFFDDFMGLSHMTYFISTYVFNPFEPEKSYKAAWKTFKTKVCSPEHINSFNNQQRSLMNMAFSLRMTGGIEEKESPMVKSRNKPPIFSNYGVIFHTDGREFKVLHYSVKQVSSNEGHVSVVLIEIEGKKYYKLSVTEGGNDAELFQHTNGNEYLNFDFSEFNEYTNTIEFIADFSMLIVKSIRPEYHEDSLPNQRYKELFDMIGY